ncbi:hypothetical protein GC088_00405 [Arthrobacter sp. JZ12]|uniref:hypothetical protein n=1 Tax=Arthrobacter sp. JZ12 TaxID=2654190 RepID=UPI002B4A1265|nr:hypothetical protein [Arthrobacter sp. JZ12]WRH23737.1 hypothetical protein GC088_00405 [Arthrobacter sp. JZ12]
MTAQPIEWTKRDLESARKVLAMSFEESEELPTLTDEEIVALDGIERDQLVALPFLEKHEEQKYLAATVALRSLMSKGIAFPVVEKGYNEPTRLNATERVTGIMTLRRTASRIITGQRTSQVGRHWLFAYVHDDIVLEEEVNDGGIHGFVVYPASRLAERLAILADPEQVAAEDSDSVELAQNEFEENGAPLLGDSRAVTVYTGASGGPETFTNLTVYAAPSSVKTLRAAEEGGAVRFTITPVSANSLRSALQSVIDDPAESTQIG